MDAPVPFYETPGEAEKEVNKLVELIKGKEVETNIDGKKFYVKVGLRKDDYLLIESKENKDNGIFFPAVYKKIFDFAEITSIIKEFRMFDSIIDIFAAFSEILDSNKYYLKINDTKLSLVIKVSNTLGKTNEYELLLDPENKKNNTLMNEKLETIISELKSENSALKKENSEIKEKMKILEIKLSKFEELLFQNINNINDLQKLNNAKNQFNSKIISLTDIAFVTEKISKINNSNLIEYKLLFRGTQNGFEARDFHKRCDRIWPTITIIKSNNGSIFGGYTEELWESEENDECKEDKNAFCFSVDKNKIYEIKNGEKAIKSSKDNGPIFYSKGFSIINIQNNPKKNRCNTCSVSESNYQNMIEDYEINKGESFFTVNEIEVYQILATN